MLHPTHKARTLAIIDGFGSGLVAVLGPGEGVGVDLGVEEHFEGSVVLDAELVIFVDVDLGEERLVAEASVGVVAAGVDIGAVGEQVEGVVEVGSGVGVVPVVGVDAAVGRVEFGQDAVLFSFENREWDGPGVVGLHEAVLFLFEAVAVGGEPVEFVGFGCHEPVEFVVKHPGEGFLLGWGDLDARVVVLDQVFDVFDEDGLAGTGGAFGVSSGADEVVVDLAVAVLGIGHDELGAALAAVDGAFEVVVVDLGGFGGGFVCGEDGLDLVPDFGGDERGMVALVSGAAVDDVALVVGVGQQPVD